MGKKNRKKKRGRQPILNLQSTTKFWIAGISLVAFAFFMTLGGFGKGGVAGTMLYSFGKSFLGFGYFLFAFLFALTGVLFITSIRPRLVMASLAGAVLILLSGLGILSLFWDSGGIVGTAVKTPFVSLFDTYASMIMLTALFITGFLVSLDKTPSLKLLRSLFTIFRKKPSGDGEKPLEPGSEKPPLKTEDHKKEESPAFTTEDTAPKEEARESSSFRILPSFKKNKEGVALPLFSHSPSKNYVPPPLSLIERDKGKPGVGDIKANANIIKRTLQNFGIDVEMDEISIGPSVTRYALKPAQGVKLSRIVGLQNDLSLALAAHPIRIEAPIPGRSLVGIEIPNSARITVGLASLFSEKEFYGSPHPLLIALGRSVTGKPYFGNLGKMPHLLIAGATGSGKSVGIHAIIASLIYRNAPEHFQFILIDPKRVELTLYNKIPHLACPVITNAKKAILSLKWAAKEMDRRYDVLEAEKVRDIESYHKNIVEPAYKKKKVRESPESGDTLPEKTPSLPERMPYIVIIIDELADIMSTYPRELETAIVRLAQMSRAVGIHLILSTQRPSVDIITGLIKANIPARVAFQVSSQTDSRTILDTGGAEKLLGAGDMLYLSGEMSKPVRLQSGFVSEHEIKKIVAYLADEHDELPHDFVFASLEQQSGSSVFDAIEEEKNEMEDDLYEDAREIVINTGRASTTFLQRKLRIGYARAASLIDMLEEHGVIGPLDASKRREVLIKPNAQEEGYGTAEKDNNGNTDPKETAA